MIDRVARDNLAERLRHLAGGAISNYKFEKRAVHTKDKAVCEIEWLLAWPSYDDFHEHTLDGKWSLTSAARRDFARAVVFLKTDLPYKWPRHSAVARVWRWIRNLFKARSSHSKPEPIEDGASSVWPFWSIAEYRLALKSPPYLNGKKRPA